jgi:hypothetical protein
MYKFQRVNSGEYKGAYSHELLQKGRVDLSLMISRIKVDRKRPSEELQEVASTNHNKQGYDNMLKPYLTISMPPTKIPSEIVDEIIATFIQRDPCV